MKQRNDLDIINRLKRESNSYRNKAQTQKGELARLNKQVAEQKAELENLRQIIRTSDKEQDKLIAEIERLEHQLETLCLTLKLAKSEAIKEFVEKFEKRCLSGGIYPAFVKRQLNDVKKEMTENDFKE